MTVSVAGKVYVDPAERDRYVAGHQVIVEKARTHPGCLDVVISADPLEPGRVDVFEHWESEEALNAWRAIAPRPAYSAEILDGEVFKHRVSPSGPPFG
ncbi:antibiotic biosynthesis monooxygenase [Amycolatopsis sp. QT-25]|uniref:putative quinol monooxygenase n=1 Tax=Amycolatopsis sp. QT-25 TaxID=3034022 RepID=UPI0023ECA29A|nr:antibiotic biosynthesis monooxygenase family protein [Amycolatopsis sp. QT-25]WET82309.1 antibiotic biosynthesis monooxygenase [Amycolatopsis sp. QT-25]